MNIIQNEQNNIVFGILCLLGVCKLGKELYGLYRKNQREIERLQNVMDRQRLNPIDLRVIKKQESGRQVLIEDILPYNVNQDTLWIRKRQVPIFQGLDPYSKKFVLEHITGGSFNFKLQGQKIVCDIKDTNITTQILDITKTPVSLFHQTNPLVNRLDMHMKRNTFLTIYGSLIFQKQSNKWIVQPFWMGHSLKEIQDYFHNEQIGYKILGSFLAIAGILVIGNFFVIPIFSYFERERKKYRQIGKDELSHFKKLNHLEADPREKLNCMKCKNNTVEIAYECGHLVVCDKCWKQLKEARNLSCPICNKDSKKFLKLYLA